MQTLEMVTLNVIYCVYRWKWKKQDEKKTQKEMGSRWKREILIITKGSRAVVRAGTGKLVQGACHGGVYVWEKKSIIVLAVNL